MPQNERGRALAGARASEWVSDTDLSETTEIPAKQQARLLTHRYGLSAAWAAVIAPMAFGPGRAA